MGTCLFRVAPAMTRKRARPSPIGFLPLLRPGDLLFTAMALQRQIVGGTTVDEAIVDVRGYMSRQRNSMGRNSSLAGLRIFGRQGQGTRVLLEHTLAGVYVRAMSETAAAAWVQQSEALGGRRMCKALGLRTWRGNHVCSAYLRSCRACVDADTSARGFAAWRVLHQVPALERCPFHGTVLVQELAPPFRQRKDPPLWHPRLPTGNASSEAHAPLPLTEGHAEYLKLWLELVNGELPAVRADQWRVVVGACADKVGGMSGLQLLLNHQIESSWGVSLDALAEHLSLAGGPSFIAEELLLRTTPKDIARRLVVYSSAMQLGLVVPDEGQIEIPLAVGAQLPSVPPDTTPESALRAAIAMYGLPVAVGDVLLAGWNNRATARKGGVSRITMRGFRRHLPTQLLQDLQNCKHFREDSWLACELRRR